MHAVMTFEQFREGFLDPFQQVNDETYAIAPAIGIFKRCVVSGFRLVDECFNGQVGEYGPVPHEQPSLP